MSLGSGGRGGAVGGSGDDMAEIDTAHDLV